MTNFIPVFPLNIVVYPGEKLNLHIFEPRYKELIIERLQDKKPFGIPSIVGEGHTEYGTLMEILSLEKTYDNGEMDIKTRGTDIFRILEVINEVPDKLYSGAIVTYPENRTVRDDSKIAALILDEVKRLYALLDLEDKFRLLQQEPLSYGIAHYVGFSLQQEYELLSIFTETQRLEYIRRHLNSVIPVVKELEKVKQRVQMNGHFRNMKLDEFGFQ